MRWQYPYITKTATEEWQFTLVPDENNFAVCVYALGPAGAIYFNDGKDATEFLPDHIKSFLSVNDPVPISEIESNEWQEVSPDTTYPNGKWVVTEIVFNYLVRDPKFAGIAFENGIAVDKNGPLTDPFKHSQWVIGSEEDCIALDAADIGNGLIAFHSVIDCGTAGFIETKDYVIVEKAFAANTAKEVVADDAKNWLAHNDVVYNYIEAAATIRSFYIHVKNLMRESAKRTK